MNIEEKVKEELDKLKPYLEAHNGGVEFIKYEDGTIYIKLLGACSHCIHANTTTTNMIEGALTMAVPEVIKVVNINE